MNKLVIIVSFVIVIIVAIFAGVFIFNSINNVDNNNVNYATNDIVNKIDYSVRNDITVKTNTIEEKISPNATLILKKKYRDCGHTIKEYKEIPEDLVNLTKEQLEGKHNDWNIEKFTSLEIILIREEEGICDEHFILKEKEGFIAIYKIEANNKEILEELTGISIEYLTESDKIELRKGIRVYGKEELNSILEDYE